MKAKVRLFWTPSVSENVVSQTLVLGVNGELTSQVFDNTVSEYVFEVNEESSVSVELTAFNGLRSSAPATLNFNIPNLAMPEAPSALNYEILEILE